MSDAYVCNGLLLALATFLVIVAGGVAVEYLYRRSCK